MTPRVAWTAMGVAVILHLALGVGQSQGWIPGEPRWLGIGAMRRRWRVESTVGAIEGFRGFGRRWLDEAATLPMGNEEFLNQHSRATGRITRSLDPEVRFDPKAPEGARWVVVPDLKPPFDRYSEADGRFQDAVMRFYVGETRGSLSEAQGAWKNLEDALDGLRSAVERAD